MAVDVPENSSGDASKSGNNKTSAPPSVDVNKMPQEVELYLHMLVLAYLLDARQLEEVGSPLSKPSEGTLWTRLRLMFAPFFFFLLCRPANAAKS